MWTQDCFDSTAPNKEMVERIQSTCQEDYYVRYGEGNKLFEIEKYEMDEARVQYGLQRGTVWYDRDPPKIEYNIRGRISHTKTQLNGYRMHMFERQKNSKDYWDVIQGKKVFGLWSYGVFDPAKGCYAGMRRKILRQTGREPLPEGSKVVWECANRDLKGFDCDDPVFPHPYYYWGKPNIEAGDGLKKYVTFCAKCFEHPFKKVKF